MKHCVAVPVRLFQCICLALYAAREVLPLGKTLALYSVCLVLFTWGRVCILLRGHAVLREPCTVSKGLNQDPVTNIWDVLSCLGLENSGN